MKALDLSLSPLISKSLARARGENSVASVEVPTNIGAPQLMSASKPVLINSEKVKEGINPEEELNIHGIPADEMTPNIKAAFDSLMEEVKALRSERVRLRTALKKAESLADSDPLSGVFNARAFLREMGRVMSFSQRYEFSSSVLFFDLNGFKAINDNYGHAAGDAIISAFAKTLAANIRESDIVGRVGGDEFAILLAKATEDEAHFKASQLVSAIDKIRVPWGNVTLTIGATIGVYEVQPKDTPQNALKFADEHMYARKIASRIQVL